MFRPPDEEAPALVLATQQRRLAEPPVLGLAVEPPKAAPPLELARRPSARRPVPAAPPEPQRSGRGWIVFVLVIGALVGAAWWQRARIEKLFAHKPLPPGKLTVDPVTATITQGPGVAVTVRAPGFVPAQVVVTPGRDLTLRLARTLAAVPDGPPVMHRDPDPDLLELQSLIELPADWSGRRVTVMARSILGSPVAEMADRVQQLDLAIESLTSPSLQTTARKFAAAARANRPYPEQRAAFNELVRAFDEGPEIWTD
jgi:hypothetical protein